MQFKHTLSGDTIAAIATPPGRGGVGIVRVSGQDLSPIISGLLTFQPQPRQAHFSAFLDEQGTPIDSGIALLFNAPHSYTGENILELQGHGGTVVMDMLLRRVLSLGARVARPGEFTERAFLNGKLDLAQAEAVIDLINSGTEAAARAAQKSLQGEFSNVVNELVIKITELRVYIEASIDFVDEEIDFLEQGDVAAKLENIRLQLDKIQQSAQQGRLLQEGMTLVIAGRPNAGKSSLLNQLTGQQSAIVSDYAGTTRDILRENIQLDGIPLHILDTAGLHQSDHPVEQEGIRRAQQAFATADRILLVIDASKTENLDTNVDPELLALLPSNIGITYIHNKIDLISIAPEIIKQANQTWIKLSANTGEGLALLKQHLKECCGYKDTQGDTFNARRRHLDALNHSQQNIDTAQQMLKHQPALELFAEELRQAQEALLEITGEFSADDLLGEIFSAFCIGK